MSVAFGADATCFGSKPDECHRFVNQHRLYVALPNTDLIIDPDPSNHGAIPQRCSPHWPLRGVGCC